MALKLRLLRGKNPGKEYLLEESPVLIGRKDVAARLYPEVDLEEEDVEAKVSRRHAHLYFGGGSYEVEDLGSLNGVGVMREGVTTLIPTGERAAIKLDDSLIFGEIILQFVDE